VIAGAAMPAAAATRPTPSTTAAVWVSAGKIASPIASAPNAGDQPFRHMWLHKGRREESRLSQQHDRATLGKNKRYECGALACDEASTQGKDDVKGRHASSDDGSQPKQLERHCTTNLARQNIALAEHGRRRRSHGIARARTTADRRANPAGQSSAY